MEGTLIMKVYFFAVLFLSFSVLADTTIEEVSYLDHPALKLSDGKSYAVVVPELGGRVMAYGLVDGENLMWNAKVKPEQIAKGGFINWGGDKSLVGPHANWWSFTNSLWPPQPSYMGDPHTVRRKDGTLITESPVWKGFNLQTIREYSFTEEGELKIVQTFKKLEGEGREMTIWNVSQVRQPDRVFTLENPESIFKNSLVVSNKRETLIVKTGEDDLQETTFVPGGASKVSFDPKVPVLVANWEELYWVQQGEMEDVKGSKSGAIQVFPVEIYTQGWEKGNYVELELMSPAFVLSAGESRTFTLYWSLHTKLELTEIKTLLEGKTE